jgi:hypothetical protein
MTVKLQDGSSKIVILSGTTSYKTTIAASKNDIKIGDAVAVAGSANSDGSVNAQNIQLNPEMTVVHKTAMDRQQKINNATYQTQTSVD